MILRFRVGTTIVDQMQKAIDLTAKRDEQFRKDLCYRKWNQPKMTHPKQVYPYTRDQQHHKAGNGVRSSEKEDAGSGDERPPAFIAAPQLQKPPAIDHERAKASRSSRGGLDLH